MVLPCLTLERFQNVVVSLLLHKLVWPAPTEMLGPMAYSVDSMRYCVVGSKMMRAGENTEQNLPIFVGSASPLMALYVHLFQNMHT